MENSLGNDNLAFFYVFSHLPSQQSWENQKQFYCLLLDEGGAKTHTRVQGGTNSPCLLRTHLAFRLSVEASNSGRRHVVMYSRVFAGRVGDHLGNMVIWNSSDLWLVQRSMVYTRLSNSSKLIMRVRGLSLMWLLWNKGLGSPLPQPLSPDMLVSRKVGQMLNCFTCICPVFTPWYYYVMFCFFYRKKFKPWVSAAIPT